MDCQRPGYRQRNPSCAFPLMEVYYIYYIIRYAPLKYLFTFNPEKKMRIANQVMDAFNYNGLISDRPFGNPVSKAGFNPIRAGLYGEYGTMSPYIRDIKPSDIHYDWSRKHNPSIKVIDAPYPSPLEHVGRTPMNTTQTSDIPTFPLGNHYAYDAGGHLIKYLPESIQASDVFKFTPSDFVLLDKFFKGPEAI